MAGIFISFRRSDAASAAARIHDRLTTAYGPNSVFMETTDLPPGEDFHDYLARHLATASALVVVIGPNWMPDGADGRSKLFDSHDYVRVELAFALERGLPVIPLLVNGASTVPEADTLPAALAALPQCPAIRLRADRFEIDMRAVEDALRGPVEADQDGPTADDLLHPSLGFTPTELSSGAVLSPLDALKLQEDRDLLHGQLRGGELPTACGSQDRALRDALAAVTDGKRFQLAPALSPALDRGARQALRLKPYQQIIAAVDMTLLRNGQAGLVVTEQGLYRYSPDDPVQFIPNHVLARGAIDGAGQDMVIIAGDVIRLTGRVNQGRAIAFLRALGQAARSVSGVSGSGGVGASLAAAS